MSDTNKAGFTSGIYTTTIPATSETELLKQENKRLKKEIENIMFQCAKEVFDIKTNFSKEIRRDYRSYLRQDIENKNYLNVFAHIDNSKSQDLVNKFGYDTIIRVIDHLYQDYLLEEQRKKREQKQEENGNE